jgi:hypothetical protein
MTDDDRANLRDKQAEIDELGRKASPGDQTAEAAMRQKQREQIEFCRALGFQVVQ